MCVFLCIARNYKATFKDSVSACKKLSKQEKKRRIEFLTEVGVQRPRAGNPNFVGYLKYDERLLIADYLEVCHFLHLPFNADSLRGLVATIAEQNGHKDPVVGRHWIKAFMEEFPRLGFYKVSNISIARAKQATTKVRDKHFGKLEALFQRLVQMKVMSEYEMKYEKDKNCFYMDEQGGGTEKTKKKVIGVAHQHGMCIYLFVINHSMYGCSSIDTMRSLQRTCVSITGLHDRSTKITTGDSQDCFHTTGAVVINYHMIAGVFMIQSETSMSEDNSKYIPDDWGMGANKKGMNTTLYVSVSVDVHETIHMHTCTHEHTYHQDQ